jgi:hypothetical protein
MIGVQLISFLELSGEGTRNVDLFLGQQPENPDVCVTLQEETAPVIDEYQEHGIDAVGIKVLIRNPDYVTASNKAYTIHGYLKNYRNAPFATDGNLVRRVIIVTSPSSIGKDEKDRHEWVINYVIEFELANSNAPIGACDTSHVATNNFKLLEV